MTQSLAVSKHSPLVAQVAKELNFPETYLNTIKDSFAKGANDEELVLFLQTARRTGLDPLARQLFLVKRWDSTVQRETMSIQISIDGFRLIADRTNKYVPSGQPTYTYDKQGNLESATATVKKLVGGAWHEIAATAFYSEYVQTKKDKTPNSMWQKMPRLMLAKCAESLALRKAFPAELSGLYTADEMGTEAAEINVSGNPSPVISDVPPVLDAALIELTEEAKEQRKEFETLLDLLNYADTKRAKYLTKFDQLPLTDRAEVFQKLNPEVTSRKIELITEGLASQNWDETEINSYLSGFDVEALNAATADQIDSIYEDLKTSNMI